MTTIQLKSKVVFRGYLVLKTGLHIGGTNAALNIGGPDKFVVRNPLTNVPYIPGSSLKGKMRSLIEIVNGETNDGNSTGSLNDKAGRLFGISADNDECRPSRLIVRDAPMALVEDGNEELEQYGLNIADIPDFSNTDLPYTESKTEVSINRITARANPRTFERVPAGAQFKIELVLNLFKDENREELLATLRQAIALLEDDYLGGHGSRGYGQVEIHLLKENGEEKHY